MTNLTIEQVENLKLHQKWRLGEIDEQPLKPKEVTDAIDYAIETILSQHKEIERLKAVVTTDNTKVNAILVEENERLKTRIKRLKAKIKEALYFTL